MGDALAGVTFEEQDAGSGPVYASPNLGPMTTAIHNISARHMHDLSLSLPDDRQFLRAWRRQLQDTMHQQNTRLVRFLCSDISGLADAEISQRCAAILNKYGKPTWSFTSSIRDLNISPDSEDVKAHIATELGMPTTALRDAIKRAIRCYTNAAAGLSAAEQRLEEKLRRLEAVYERVNALMFMEPTAALEELGTATKNYLLSVLERIDLESDYGELIACYKKFAALRGLVSLASFQRSSTAPTCTICMTREVSQAMTPCGHTFCEECCRAQMTACYICRLQIRDKVRLYFS